MAIEIRELVIRARIESGRNPDPGPRPATPLPPRAHGASKVVDDVMRILKDQRER